MMGVCQALGLARSNIHIHLRRSASWLDGRTGPTPIGDEQLLSDIREQITDLPSYGYRRACALLNRHRASGDAARVSPKRVDRVSSIPGRFIANNPAWPRGAIPHAH
jgi:hypothetical protein